MKKPPKTTGNNRAGNNRTPRRLQPAKPMNASEAKANVSRKRKAFQPNFKKIAKSPISKAGSAFLKCAYAAPDFNVDPGMGIPDEYDGKVLMRKEVLTDAGFTFYSAGKNIVSYILVLPTPGIAYWYLNIDTALASQYPSQAAAWTPVYYPSFDTFYGTKQNQAVNAPTDPVERNVNFQKFRYASTCVEITATSNFTQAAGSIIAWKFPVGLTNAVKTNAVQAQTTTFAINGIDALIKIPTENKPFKFMDGIYTMAVNCQPDFPFHEIESGITRVPLLTEGATTNPTWGQFQGDILGMGDMEGICIRTDSPSGCVNTAIIKIWSCMELQPTKSSPYYEFAGVSPPHDPMAMKLYREIALKIPVAVSSDENDGFWSDRILPFLKVGLDFGRVVGKQIPQVGAVVQGIDTLSSLFALM